MLLAPKTPALRRWRLWFGALIIAEIGWFALMRPPFHGHFRSLVMLALIPIAVVGYVYLLAAVAVYLDSRDWDYQMRQLIVVMLGLSVGFFVFTLMSISTAQLEASAAECPHAGCAEAEEKRAPTLGGVSLQASPRDHCVRGCRVANTLGTSRSTPRQGGRAGAA